MEIKVKVKDVVFWSGFISSNKIGSLKMPWEEALKWGETISSVEEAMNEVIEKHSLKESEGGISVPGETMEHEVGVAIKLDPDQFWFLEATPSETKLVNSYLKGGIT